MVRRELFPSRERAQDAIAEAKVLVNGVVAYKAARLVDPGDAIALLAPAARFVSRGGEKLDAALEHFQIAVSGARCLDAGVSTGGFTDCLLQRGARQVVAVDVGHGQLHERLRGDDRIVLMERTNIRSLDAAVIGGACGVIVADLSFISLRTAAPALLSCATRGADLVLLVKPQFEAGRAEASRGRGVIRDPAVRARVLEEVATAIGALGASIMGTMQSPIKGADGNIEFLLHARCQ